MEKPRKEPERVATDLWLLAGVDGPAEATRLRARALALGEHPVAVALGVTVGGLLAGLVTLRGDSYRWPRAVLTLLWFVAAATGAKTGAAARRLTATRVLRRVLASEGRCERCGHTLCQEKRCCPECGWRRLGN